MAFISSSTHTIKYEIKGIDKVLSEEEKRIVETAIEKIHTESHLNKGQYILTAEKITKLGSKEEVTNSTLNKLIRKIAGTEEVANISVEVEIKPSKFQHITEEMYETEKSYHEDISVIAKAYKNDPTFKEILKKEGFTNEEIEKIFSSYPELDKQTAFFERELEKIYKLALEGKTVEAMDRYTSLIKNNFHKYMGVHKKASGSFDYFNDLDIEKRHALERASNNYFSSKVKNKIFDFSSTHIESTQRPPRHLLLNESILKSTGLPQSDSWDETKVIIRNEISNFNNEKDLKNRLIKFYDHIKLTESTAWKDTIKLNDKNKILSPKKEKAFYKLCNDYGDVITPLKEAYDDYLQNPTPENRIRFRALAKKLLPKINQLNIRLIKTKALEKARLHHLALFALPKKAYIDIKENDVGQWLFDRIRYLDSIYLDPELNLSEDVLNAKFRDLQSADPQMFDEVLKANKLKKSDIKSLNKLNHSILEEQEKLLASEVAKRLNPKDSDNKKLRIASEKKLKSLHQSFRKWGGSKKLERVENSLKQMKHNLELKMRNAPEIQKSSFRRALDSIKGFSPLERIGAASFFIRNSTRINLFK